MATLVGDAATLQGKYVVLDTTVGSTRSVIVPQLSGHQGMLDELSTWPSKMAQRLITWTAKNWF